MNKKKIFNILGALAMVAAVAMYVIGSNDGHLTELKDFFWAPLPLSVIFFVNSFNSDKARLIEISILTLQ